MKGKHKIVIIIIILLLAIIAGCVFFYLNHNKSQESELFPQMDQMGEDIVMASALTSTGMSEVEYELDFLETELYVEESYLSIGDTVEAGIPVFKVTDESLKEAREELEYEVTETNLAYRQGVINNTQDKLEAENTYQQTIINNEYAQAEYDSSLEETKQKVVDVTKQVEEAQELYDEYKRVVDDDYYYTYYNIKELYDAYYDNFTFLMKLYEEWDIEGLNDKYPNGVSSSLGGGNQGNSDEAGKLTVYEMMDEVVQKNGEEYETAMESYEKESAMAAASLDQAKSNMTTLQAELSEAQLAYEKQVIASKADFDSTKAESENAKTVYDTSINKLNEELESLQDAAEEAAENLSVFESTIGDGRFYTKSAGILVMNRVRENSILSSDGIILAYSNPETVTVAASVDQSDIAKVNVGDSAYVVINEYGNYNGTVISINPVSSSNSKSSVTYTVTVELEGDMSSLESNLTAYVYIGLSEKQIQEMTAGNKRKSADGRMENDGGHKE